jgi:hypothetical protein
MDNKLIKTTIEDHVALVMLDNQPVNAQSREFVEELISVFDELNETPTVRVIVMASNCKVFSAGADIKSRSKVGQGAPGDTYRHLRRTRRDDERDRASTTIRPSILLSIMESIMFPRRDDGDVRCPPSHKASSARSCNVWIFYSNRDFVSFSRFSSRTPRQPPARGFTRPRTGTGSASIKRHRSGPMRTGTAQMTHIADILPRFIRARSLINN